MTPMGFRAFENLIRFWRGGILTQALSITSCRVLPRSHVAATGSSHPARANGFSRPSGPFVPCQRRTLSWLHEAPWTEDSLQLFISVLVYPNAYFQYGLDTAAGNTSRMEKHLTLVLWSGRRLPSIFSHADQSHFDASRNRRQGSRHHSALLAPFSHCDAGSNHSVMNMPACARSCSSDRNNQAGVA